MIAKLTKLFTALPHVQTIEIANAMPGCFTVWYSVNFHSQIPDLHALGNDLRAALPGYNVRVSSKVMQRHGGVANSVHIADLSKV